MGGPSRALVALLLATSFAGAYAVWPLDLFLGLASTAFAIAAVSTATSPWRRGAR